jgi:N-acetylmuramic acid 6-phosphate etherase
LSEAELATIKASMNAETGDAILFVAGERKMVNLSLGKVRSWVAGELKLADPNTLAFCWIVDFPMYEYDDEKQAWLDMESYGIDTLDTVIGIAASGRTPYVVGGLRDANARGILTGCIVCNGGSVVAAEAKYPIEVIVGPEYVTGSTRMKSGTAQKLVLNMLSTAVMIQLGRVRGNKMVDMQLSNHKLVLRAIRMVREATGVSDEVAAELLEKHGSVRNAVDAIQAK